MPLPINQNQFGLEVDLIASDGTTIQFNTKVPDGAGAVWWCSDLQGWEAPDPRQKWLDRTQDHGSIPAESFFDKRSLVMVGFVILPPLPTFADTFAAQTAFWTTWNKLTNFFGIDIVGDATSKLLVYEIPYPQYSLIKLTGRPKFKLHPGYFEYNLSLIAPDPHKYRNDLGGPGSDPGRW